MSDPDRKLRVLIFDDQHEDVALFKGALEESGCEVRALDNARCDNLREILQDFLPDACIVDCYFDFAIDGANIVAQLQRENATIPIVVCSKLLDTLQSRTSVVATYERLPGVRALIGKRPFPTGAELLRRAGVR